MTYHAIGDLAQHALQRAAMARVDRALIQTSGELDSGLAADAGRELGGKTEALSAIDRRLSVLNAYATSSSEAKLILDGTQAALSRLSDRLGAVGLENLDIEERSSAVRVDIVAQAARSSFQGIIQDLNTQLGGYALFAGAQNSGRATIDAADILDDLRGAVGGATTHQQVIDAVDLYFAPGGDFETGGYQGAAVSRDPARVGNGSPIPLDLRADNEGLRTTLRTLGRLAMSDAFAAADRDERVAVLNGTRSLYLEAKEDLIQLSGSTGLSQARLEEAVISNTEERNGLSAMRLDLIGKDRFASATRLTELGTQMELLYTVTSRLSRLKLSDYL